MNQNNLIFLISQPRSGSTLTQKLLANHSKIYTRSEPWLMLHPAYSLKNKGMYTEYGFETERIAFKDFINSLPGGRETYVSELRNNYLKLYSYFTDTTKCSYFLDKTPRYYLVVKELLEFFPEAKYILLIRNPLAVLSSIINTWTKDKWYNLFMYKYDLLEGINSILFILENYTDKYSIVRYEELIDDPEHEVSLLFDYLELDCEEGMTDLSYEEGKWLYGDQNIYNTKTIDKKSKEKWQNNLINPQHWRVLNDYLSYIGKERFEKLGYDYKKTQDILRNLMPLDTLDEINKNTIDLFTLLDNKRDYLIDNQKYKHTIQESQKIIEESKIIIASNNLELKNYRMLLKKIRNYAGISYMPNPLKKLFGILLVIKHAKRITDNNNPAK